MSQLDPMNALTPLEVLFDLEGRDVLPLPAVLARLYGRLAFPSHGDRAHVVGNFVTTLDGVVTLNEPDHMGGGDISGFNQHDQMVMGLLRASADAVIVGAGTLRSAPQHLWTARSIYPPLADAYQQLRTSLRKQAEPLCVIVTAQGRMNLDLPVFQSGAAPVLLVTTTRGMKNLQARRLPPGVEIQAVPGADALSARAILQVVERVRRCEVILVEGGPRLMGDFFAEQLLDEQFLTLAPQVAGRDTDDKRPGFVAGRRFASEHPRWGTLVSVRRGGSHLFLRYAFATDETDA